MSADAIHPAEDTAWTTVVGTITKGMKVIDAEGTCLGLVASVKGDEVMLAGDGGHSFIAISQIDGIGEEGILLCDRGDITFGMPSQT